MTTLLVMRHAKSSWKDARLSDHDRPLNKRGKGDAARMGRLLRAEGLVPDLVLGSTAKRARSTIKRLAREAGYDGPIELSETLYHCAVRDFETAIAGARDRGARLLLVGHNPGVEEFIEHATGAWEVMPTAAVARIEIGDAGPPRLVRVWRPRELPPDDAASHSG